VGAVDLLEVVYAPSARLRCARGGRDLQDLRGLLFEVESVRQAGQRIRQSQPQQPGGNPQFGRDVGNNQM
jgi:hypothetical protein